MHRASSLRRCRPRRTLLVAVLLLAGTGAFLSTAAQGADTSWSTRVQYGKASWYGSYFHGRSTASGERFHMHELTAAHRSAPLGTQAMVTNLNNGQSVRVRINDRGPYVRDRIVDLSLGAARRLGMVNGGVAPVKVEFLPATTWATTEEPLTVAMPEPPLTFVVQAGTFSDLQQAKLVQQALTDYAPQVWTSAAATDTDMLYRVRFGLFPNREVAEQAAREIAKYGFSTSVMPFR